MGLSVGTHNYAYNLANDDDPEYREEMRADLRALNALLAAEGLPAHEEPESYGAATSREEINGVPYGFVHYLRRAYARAVEYPDQPLTPVAEGEQPTDDPVLDTVACMFESHLICHSDCEGYYVPIDFGAVLYPQDEDAIPGGMVGSSQGLLRELVEVAPYIGITLDDGELSDTEAARLADYSDLHPFYRERETWFLLYESARVSIANNTLITFC
ncbi:hypothetical protein [Nocardia inohanensis]|uniref:hypothetical protein n=1 Tax=Nocardia inohanensis TaxID=209246 RepID=UPI00082E2F8A|nr:hypothetical protein [Nocardia inohanensis]